jgi:hypothetical protein
LRGRIGLRAEFEGSGLSAASLVGSLKGAGLITLEDAQISGLDPKAFNAAIRAADHAAAVDSGKIRDIVATVLDGGALGGTVARCTLHAGGRTGARRPDQGAGAGRRTSSSRRARISPRPRSMCGSP